MKKFKKAIAVLAVLSTVLASASAMTGCKGSDKPAQSSKPQSASQTENDTESEKPGAESADYSRYTVDDVRSIYLSRSSSSADYCYSFGVYEDDETKGKALFDARCCIDTGDRFTPIDFEGKELSDEDLWELKNIVSLTGILQRTAELSEQSDAAGGLDEIVLDETTYSISFGFGEYKYISAGTGCSELEELFYELAEKYS